MSTTTRRTSVGQVGERGGGGLEVVDAGEVARRDAQQLAALPGDEVAEPARRVGRAARRRCSIASASASVASTRARLRLAASTATSGSATASRSPARVRQAVEGRPDARRIGRALGQLVDHGRCGARSAMWASQRSPSASSPRHRANAPISTASDEAPLAQRRRRPPRSRRRRSRSRSASVSAGSAVSQRIGLGHEARTVVGRVADHRLRVDGEPRLALRRQDVGGVEVAVQQDRARRSARGRVRIVSRARRTRPGSRPAVGSRCSSTSSAHGIEHVLEASAARRAAATAWRRAPMADPTATASSVPPSLDRGRGPDGSARSAAPAGRDRGRSRRTAPSPAQARSAERFGRPTPGAGAGP